MRSPLSQVTLYKFYTNPAFILKRMAVLMLDTRFTLWLSRTILSAMGIAPGLVTGHVLKGKIMWDSLTS